MRYQVGNPALAPGSPLRSPWAHPQPHVPAGLFLGKKRSQAPKKKKSRKKRPKKNLHPTFTLLDSSTVAHKLYILKSKSYVLDWLLSPISQTGDIPQPEPSILNLKPYGLHSLFSAGHEHWRKPSLDSWLSSPSLVRTRGTFQGIVAARGTLKGEPLRRNPCRNLRRGSRQGNSILCTM